MCKIDGRSNTRLYKLYKGIKGRCYTHGSRYNMAGITMCDEWRLDFLKFKTWAISNGYNDTLTIDRRDNSLGYTATNCRWVSQKVQQNNRTNNHLLEVNGIVKTLSQWCEIYNIGHSTVIKRINSGWDIKTAITKPLMKNQYG